MYAVFITKQKLAYTNILLSCLKLFKLEIIKLFLVKIGNNFMSYCISVLILLSTISVGQQTKIKNYKLPIKMFI